MTRLSLHIPRLLVFDLDGTLVDSVPDLLSCANRMLDRRMLPHISADELRPMVGDGVTALVERVLISRGAVADNRAVSAYMADYAVHAADDSQLFPEVESMLHEARADGWRLAVCTNKPVAAARLLLDALGIGPLFACIGGGDSFSSRKPDPAHLLGTIAMAEGRREQAVMVGDHRNDIVAARGAGIHSIFAAWGYGEPEMQNGAGAILATPSEVPAAAASLLASP
jgi:phosphoglycolate phosphatase